ncbi:hypothetical protein EDB89DRAFT_1977592 [Lactarius sanguifluus]|nr:hypothetical protein EDB89DRAFT_1977592 [Lactarius sanguifluus]
MNLESSQPPTQTPLRFSESRSNYTKESRRRRTERWHSPRSKSRSDRDAGSVTGYGKGSEPCPSTSFAASLLFCHLLSAMCYLPRFLLVVADVTSTTHIIPHFTPPACDLPAIHNDCQTLSSPTLSHCVRRTTFVTISERCRQSSARFLPERYRE